MDPIAQLALATLVFLAAHFVPSTPLRARLVSALGQGPYLGLYVAIAFATLGWMSIAFAKAPFEPLWHPWRALPVWVMPIAFILLACALMTRNPTAVRQESALQAAEPTRGILRVTRHPLMWAFMFWAAVHVLARGDLASLIFFGGLFVLAAAGGVLIDRRRAATLGEGWRRFAGATSNVPFAAILGGRNRLDLAEIGWLKPVVGLVLFALFFAIHPWLFGARHY